MSGARCTAGIQHRHLLSTLPQAQQRDLTARRVKEAEKELGRQLRQQKEQYEATIQRHLSFIDQVTVGGGADPGRGCRSDTRASPYPCHS